MFPARSTTLTLTLCGPSIAAWKPGEMDVMVSSSAVVDITFASVTVYCTVTGARRNCPSIAGAVITTTGGVLSTVNVRVDIARSLWLPE